MKLIDKYIKYWANNIINESKNSRILRFINFNYNKWNKDINDCAIRAICAGTNMDYEYVCKKLDVKYKVGQGLIQDDGIELSLINEKFKDYFDVIQDFTVNYDFSEDSKEEYIDLRQFDIDNDIDSFSSGITLQEFLTDYYPERAEYLISLEKNLHAQNDNCKINGHIVYGNCKCLNDTRPYFVDTWDCREMIVDCYMKINKKVPLGNKEHLKYDKINKKFI